MKFNLTIIILTFLFILWTIYFVYEMNKPIIYDISSPPIQEEQNIIPLLDETKMPEDGKM